MRPSLTRKNILLGAVYLAATIQFVWCYLWLTRPYIFTFLYEHGLERMPFQGRMLMMLPMSMAHHAKWLALPFGHSKFWFPRPVAPEVLIQAAIDILSILVAGWMTILIYRASSRYRLLTPLIYPLLLVVCALTYVMHTTQNFRFIYDLPSLAFFSVAMYLLYFRKAWGWFAALFCLATINRETTLLLLPLFLINNAMQEGKFNWRLLLRARPLALAVSLGLFWAAWQLVVGRLFAYNQSEFYPRINWNVKSLLLPFAWPQLISAGGYLLPFILILWRKIPDARLRAWLWLMPIWLVFMFVYGILVETRVFGELIPLIVCTSALIAEELLVARMSGLERKPSLILIDSAEERRRAA